MCSCYLFSAKNCMTTSESKSRFFTKWIDSHKESNRIDSNREWNALTDTDCLDHAGLSLVQVFPELHNFLAEGTSQLLWTFNYNLLLWRQYRNHFPVQWRNWNSAAPINKYPIPALPSRVILVMELILVIVLVSFQTHNFYII